MRRVEKAPAWRKERDQGIERKTRGTFPLKMR
jgi:hypothetical protein